MMNLSKQKLHFMSHIMTQKEVDLSHFMYYAVIIPPASLLLFAAAAKLAVAVNYQLTLEEDRLLQLPAFLIAFLCSVSSRSSTIISGFLTPTHSFLLANSIVLVILLTSCCSSSTSAALASASAGAKSPTRRSTSSAGAELAGAAAGAPHHEEDSKFSEGNLEMRTKKKKAALSSLARKHVHQAAVTVSTATLLKKQLPGSNHHGSAEKSLTRDYTSVVKIRPQEIKPPPSSSSSMVMQVPSHDQKSTNPYTISAAAESQSSRSRNFTSMVRSKSQTHIASTARSHPDHPSTYRPSISQLPKASANSSPLSLRRSVTVDSALSNPCSSYHRHHGMTIARPTERPVDSLDDEALNQRFTDFINRRFAEMKRESLAC